MSDPNLPDPSGFTAFQPVVSNPRNGDLTTLCQILESVAPNGSLAEGFRIPPYDEVTFDNNGNGDPTEIYFKKYTPNGTQTIFYLNLGYDGNGHLNRISNDN
jgi:hypothetical protein